MLKRLFQNYQSDAESRSKADHETDAARPFGQGGSADVRGNARTPIVSASSLPAAVTPASIVAIAPTAGSADSFDNIYNTACNKPPISSYGILKVAEMVSSPHLAGMLPEVKRNCIMMALDTAGAEIDHLLEDAVFRQRALNDHEDLLQKKQRDFEAVKSCEVGMLQAELERVSTQYLTRIQSSLDEVTREQDHLRGWQRRKQQESMRIADAAMYCVPKRADTINDGFATLLERGAAASWR